MSEHKFSEMSANGRYAIYVDKYGNKIRVPVASSKGKPRYKSTSRPAPRKVMLSSLNVGQKFRYRLGGPLYEVFDLWSAAKFWVRHLKTGNTYSVATNKYVFKQR